MNKCCPTCKGSGVVAVKAAAKGRADDYKYNASGRCRGCGNLRGAGHFTGCWHYGWPAKPLGPGFVKPGTAAAAKLAGSIEQQLAENEKVAREIRDRIEYRRKAAKVPA